MQPTTLRLSTHTPLQLGHLPGCKPSLWQAVLFVCLSFLNWQQARQRLTLLGLFLFGLASPLLAQNAPFITRWDLSKPGASSTGLTIPMKATTGQQVSYTWTTVPAGTSGAGTFTTSGLILTGLPAGATIDLSVAPTNLESISMGAISVDSRRLIEIRQWGDVAWTSMESAFSGCSNMTLTATDVPNTAAVTNMSGMFAGCSSFNQALPATFNTSNVTNMSAMFAGCTAYNQALPASFNTDKVTNMSNMFSGCTAFNQPLPAGFKCKVTTDVSYMFANASAFNQNLVGVFIFPNGAINMEGLFDYCGLDMVNYTAIRADFFSNIVNRTGAFGGTVGAAGMKYCAGLFNLFVWEDLYYSQVNEAEFGYLYFLSFQGDAQSSMCDDGIVGIVGSNPTCSGANGKIAFVTTTLTGAQTLSYKKDGNATTAPINIASTSISVRGFTIVRGVFELTGLGAGVYSDFAIGATTPLGSQTLEAPALPTAFNVTGGGEACPGASGVAIRLNGSQSGVSYQLKRNNINIGSALPGTGNPLIFGNVSTAGNYTVEASIANSCATVMPGQAEVSTPNPAAGSVSVNQTICTGTAPANLSVSGLVGSVVKWQRATNANFTEAVNINVASATLPGSRIGAISTDTWFRAVIQNGTCAAINTNAVRISVLTSFEAEASASSSLICSNQTLTLTATPNQAGLTYRWSGPANFSSTLRNPTRTGLTTAMSGIYSVTVTRSACNITGSATVSVVVSPSGSNFSPQMTALAINGAAPNAQTNTVSVCAGLPVSLDIRANQHAVTYNWRGPAGGSGSGFMSAPVNGVTNASASVTAAVAANQQGQYTVTVRNGCSVANHRVINLQVRNCTNARLAAANDEATLGLDISVAPNPVREVLNVQVQGIEGESLQLGLHDAQGRSLQQVSIEAAEGKAQHRFDLRSLPAGLYLLQAESNSQRASKKVIKVD